MEVLVKGKKNSKLSSEEIYFATKYFSQLLMSKRLMKALVVEVNFTKDISTDGNSVWVDDNHRPREFEININSKMGTRKQLITLAHEIVHVKQYAKGELKSLLRTSTERWHGKYIQTDELNYFDRPWEIEAFGREYGMYARYMQWKKVNKLKF